MTDSPAISTQRPERSLRIPIFDALLSRCAARQRNLLDQNALTRVVVTAGTSAVFALPDKRQLSTHVTASLSGALLVRKLFAR